MRNGRDAARARLPDLRQSRLDLAFDQYQSRVTLYRVLGEGGEAPNDEAATPST